MKIIYLRCPKLLGGCTSSITMRLVLFFLLNAMFNASASSFAQKLTIEERNVPLESLLKKIRLQSGYDFFYNADLIKTSKPVTINVKNASIEDVLRISFEDQPLTYTLTAKTVIIRKSKELSLPPVEIRGRVIDNSGLPLPGVSIRVKGSTMGTSTNLNGEFVLPNVPDNATLQISFIGYTSKEVAVKRNIGTIKLELADSKLNEVVVVGYGSVKKSDVTGSIASIKPNENDASKAVSVDNLLQGKIPGVSVSGSVATPGAASSVTIRGANSLRGDNQPLYVIDNIPQASTGEFAASAFGGSDFQIAQNPLTNLNPSDIADIQILKDASATAIYGSRGANGVIIITTKRGKAGAARVSANANYTVVQATNYRNMMNLREYAAYRNEKTGPAGTQYFQVGDETRYIFSGGVYNAEDPATYRILNEKNWQKEIYRNALSQNYDLTVSGGSKGIKYYLSTDFKNINGMVKETGLRQGGLRLNLNGDISKSLSFNASMSGSMKKNNMMSGGNARGGATGSITRTAIDAAPYIIPSDDPILLTNEESRSTVMGWLNDYDDITSENSYRASADLTWKISKKFSYNLRTGGNILTQDRSRWYGLQLFKGLNENGSLGLSNLNSNNYTVENLINFNHSAGKMLDISATAGVTYDDYNWVNKNTTASDFKFKDLRSNGLHMASIVNETQPIQRDYQLMSYLGRLNLSFLQGRYLATVTARADGTSKFKKGSRWAYFPSFSLAWRMEQEEFLKEVEWVNQLKFRVGYGKTGSQSISPYNSFYEYEQAINYALANGDRQLAIAVTNLQNSDLKWETTSAFNGGLDFEFFGSRLTGSLDAYYKETNDLLIQKTLPASTSFNSFVVNQGSLSNKGLELSLTGDIIKSSDFGWSLSGNIGINRSNIRNLGYPEASYGNERYRAYLGNSIGDHFGVANIFIVGKEPGLFWGYKTNGIVQSTDKDLPMSSIFNLTPGNIKVVDVTGDGIVDVKDKTIIGNPNPDFNYGFQTSLRYRKLNLSATFYGVQGIDALNGNVRYEQTPSKNTGNLTSDAFRNAWRSEAESNLYSSVNSTLSSVVYDRYVEDASFLRLNDVTLSYSLPKQLLKGVVQNLNVFTSVKNVFVITNYSGYDPEMRTFAFDGLRPGIDLNSYSNPRQFIFGLNLTF